MASEQNSRSLVAGVQLALKSETTRGQEDGGFPDVDFKKSLQHFLNGVFDHGGEVVLAFPNSTYAQVSPHYTDNHLQTSSPKRLQAMLTASEWQQSAPLGDRPESRPELPNIIVSLQCLVVSVVQSEAKKN